MNNRLLKALKCQNEGRPPVWLMRQAGRYMPEYRAIRSKYSFLEMVHNPEIAAEVTMLPMKLIGVDAAILFSDILVIAEAFGVGLRFEEGVGPVIDRPVRTLADVERLPNPESCEFVGDAIRLLLPELKVPLIGFAGAPFTVASYMVEGKSSRDLKNTKQWMYSDPQGFSALLDRITTATIDYLNMQIRAGAQALQLFDSWANALSYDAFSTYSLPYMQRILSNLEDPSIPVILFCRGSSLFAKEMAALQPAAISLDWQCEMRKVRQEVGPNICLQGNLDPALLYAPHKTIKKEVQALISSMEGDPGFILNLGHGLCPDMDVDAVRALVGAVKESSLLTTAGSV